MNNERDFAMEQRLGQGLKRWAEAGQPTLDLEAFVTERTQGQPAGATATTQAPRPRRWLRWVSGGAMAAAVIVGMIFTFPQWAGAAANWPIVGPVVTEIIMKDAGLKWAYENDLLQETVAHDTQDGVTVRILGVMTGPIRTTFIYQITGLPNPTPSTMASKPARAGQGLFSDLTRPSDDMPAIRVNKLPGDKPVVLRQEQPIWTPVGLVGTATTSPIGQVEGDIDLTFDIQGHNLRVTFPASRAAVDNLTREVPLGQTKQIGEVAITVDAVIFSPLDTVVRYKINKPEFKDGWSWSGEELITYIESGGQRHLSTHSYNEGEYSYQSFPVVKGPTRLVFPGEVVGADTDLNWVLTAPAATQHALGVPITMEHSERRGDRLAIRWSYPRTDALVVFGQFELVDAAGNTHRLNMKASSLSSPIDDKTPTVFTVEAELPAGIDPVSVRAHSIAKVLWGPWSFDLPPR